MITSLKRLMGRYAEVQLATLVDTAPDGDEWLNEIKFDGYRLLGLVSDGTARLRTRNGNDWTAKFPAVAAALEKVKARNAVLDMEAVILDARGKSHFYALQDALGIGGNANKIVGYVFDLLHLDGNTLTDLPLTERKEKLKALLRRSKANRALRYSEHVVGQAMRLFSKACASGLEGIISKQANAPYKTGRQKSWLKVKCGQRQEFIILGYSSARAGNRALGALHLGYREKGILRYAGKVGTGFSMRGASDLATRFRKLAVAKPTLARGAAGDLPAREWQSIHWIRPILLCEVAFTEWTRDGLLRHPSFQGLREDKKARGVRKEIPIRRQR